MTEYTPSAPNNWRKSSYNNSEGGSCVEVQDHHSHAVPVRDSKTPHAPALLIPLAGWASFVEAVKAGKLTA